MPLTEEQLMMWENYVKWYNGEPCDGEPISPMAWHDVVLAVDAELRDAHITPLLDCATQCPRLMKAEAERDRWKASAEDMTNVYTASKLYHAELIANSDATIRQLQAETRAEQAERLLCDLTIGGSEFAGNPQNCARWIRNEMDSSFKAAIDANVRCHAAEAELATLRLVVDSECPIGALDLVTSLRVEKQQTMDALAAAEARAEHWKATSRIDLEQARASSEREAAAEARAEGMRTALMGLMEPPVALTDETGSLCAFCSKFTTTDTPEAHAEWCPLQAARAALGKELTRLYAIERAAREYAAANSEVYEHAWTPQAWQRRRQAHDALIEAVGEVTT